ncbi:MAG: 30S ribosomal protein S4 [bacterium]|nr:30S ribosomal protein S4 [bacterium]
MIRPAKYKVCRQLGERIYTKCQTPKYAVRAARKTTNTRRGRGKSDYGLQLLEKQKIRFSYGISDRQFGNYISVAREKGGKNAPHMLYSLLERRLDNVVFNLGLATSRAFARQVVGHGHIMVNGRKMNIPSYQVKEGDVISVRPGSAENAIFKAAKERGDTKNTPTWLTIDEKTLTGTVLNDPDQPSSSDGLNYATVIEFYSR